MHARTSTLASEILPKAEMNQHDDKIAAYLEKMGVKKHHTNVSLAFLSELQTRHIHTFTHDTIDTYFKRPITLNADVIIDKFLKEQRGGLCFELNGAFCYLLQNLGFNATLMSARVNHVNERAYDFPIDTHAVIVVTLDKQEYLVDVGFADSSRKPILLRGGNHNDQNGIYRCGVREVESSLSCDFYKYLSENWILQYRFTLEPKKLADFQPNLNFVCSPQHEFSKKLICTQSIEAGHTALLCLSNPDNLSICRKLLLKRGNEERERPLESFIEVKELLIKQFGMSQTLVNELIEPTNLSSGVELKVGIPLTTCKVI